MPAFVPVERPPSEVDLDSAERLAEGDAALDEGAEVEGAPDEAPDDVADKFADEDADELADEPTDEDADELADELVDDVAVEVAEVAVVLDCWRLTGGIVKAAAVPQQVVLTLPQQKRVESWGQIVTSVLLLLFYISHNQLDTDFKPEIERQQLFLKNIKS